MQRCVCMCVRGYSRSVYEMLVVYSGILEHHRVVHTRYTGLLLKQCLIQREVQIAIDIFYFLS